MRHFLIALQFLTPLSFGKVNVVSDEELAKSMRWFAVTGLLIGLVLAGVHSLLSLFLPRMAAAGFVVLLMLVISGGLHLDGLADTVDGLTGGKGKEDILRIMHNSDIGAIGAAGMFVCLLIKFSCIFSLSGSIASGALITSATFARWAFVFSAAKWKQASDNSGLGSKFIKFVTAKELFWSSAAMFITALFAFGIKGIGITAAAVFFVTVFNNFISRKIGGLTGDTIGAAGELSEAFVLVVISAMVK